MYDSDHKGGIRFLIESVSGLPIYTHLLIYTTSFFLPLFIIIAVAVYEIGDLDESSGKLGQLRLASFNVESVQAATGKILILSDLIYASSETYLIDGAISLGNSTLASYRGIDFAGYVSDTEIQEYDLYLTKVMTGLTNLSYLDAIQSAQQLDRFLVDYDQNSQYLLVSLIELKQTLDARLKAMTLQVSNDRTELIFGGIGALLAWACYAFVIFRIHLNYLARPVEFLDRAALSAISESDLIELPDKGPREYRSLSRSFAAYDQQLAARRELLKMISDISTHLMSIDKVLDSYDIVIKDLQNGFGTRHVVWYERDSTGDYVTSLEQVSGSNNLVLPELVPEKSYCVNQLSVHIGIRAQSTHEMILSDFFEKATGLEQIDPVVGFIGVHLEGELQSFVVIVNPRQELLAIFNERSLEQIGQVISTSMEKLTLGEHLEERVRVRTEDLEKEKVKAEAANIAKSSFLSNMTHEIRTPFNGIIGMSDLLQQSELDEQQSLFVKTILSQSRHLLNLLSGILDFSRLEAGSIEANPMRVNLLASIKDLVSIASEKNKNAVHKIRLNTSLESGLYLQCDEDLIQQVVKGLIGNAQQHSEARNIVVDIQASAVIDQHTEITIAVIDDGVGINQQLHEKLFEPFVQGENKSLAGTGLGLASFSRMVSLMGGQLQVESAEGEGSRFFFELRLPVVESATREEERIKRFMASDSYHPEQVLFLDDGSLDNSIYQLVQQLQLASKVIGVADVEGMLPLNDRESTLIFVNLGLDGVLLRAFLDILQRQSDLGVFSGSKALVIGIGSSQSDFEAAYPGYGLFNGFLNTPVYAKEFLGEITRLKKLNWSEDKSVIT